MYCVIVDYYYAYKRTLQTAYGGYASRVLILFHCSCETRNPNDQHRIFHSQRHSDPDPACPLWNTLM